MIRYCLVAFGMLILWSGTALAEGRCPPGYFPTGGADVGWYSCAPMGPAPEADGEALQPPDDGPEWETRWGAIAIGKEGLGAAADMPSENKARKAALAKCRATETKDPKSCKLFTYYNQCAVIAWGDTGYVIQAASDLQAASSTGIRKCSNKHQGCEIYYSDCTYPRKIN